MKIAIHQPNYLPYPGFFAKASLCDIFVLYDSAQFTRGDYFNRNRIRTFLPNGWIWLTLPVGKRNYKGIPISKVEIKNERIFNKHSKTIKAMYLRAPYFDEDLSECIRTGNKFLAEHNITLLRFFLDKLDIHPKLVRSSELGIPIRNKTSGIIDIMKALNGTEYISGLGARTYLDEQRFKEESIDLSYIAYEPLEYPQIHPGFVKNMSIVDAVFNMGWKKTGVMLKKTGIQKVVTISNP